MENEELINYYESAETEIKESFDKVLNPVDDFDPNVFDPATDYSQEYYALKRDRVDPPYLLPTMGLKPKELLEGQMIGMYESKQDLYLLFAHKYNELRKELDELKKLINK